MQSFDLVKNTTLDYSDDEIKRAMIEKEVNLFDFIPFNFINDHKGFKAGKTHVLMGETGKGKSTIVRALITATAKNCKTFLYATEESSEDWKVEFTTNNVSKSIMQKIVFLHEDEILDLGAIEPEEFVEILVKKFIESQCGIMFFDNLTMSAFYDGHAPAKQAKIFRLLKSAFLKIKRPVVFIAHTNSQVNTSIGRMFEPYDIAGSKAPAKGAQFFYIIYRVNYYDSQTGKDGIAVFIRVCKARGHKNQDKIYQLTYDALQQKYTGDKLIDFESFKACYDMRHKLTKSK
jgi:hypothetical protein